LSVMNQNGQATSLPGFDPTGGWETEAALDVEWAHAAAPGAQIVVVEANSQSLADLMSAVAMAASQPGVSVVSMSWGFAEGQTVFQRDEALYDSYLTTPAGHQPVTFVASTGDYGTADPEYPSFSPNVLAVGGTSLSLNTDGSYNSETGWGYYSSAAGRLVGSGGGASLYEPQPAYQLGVQATGMRSTPDVSLVADPATGGWIADSYNLPADNPWEVAGGTSLSAPSWAGLIAVVNQGRLANGEAVLSSSGGVEAQAALYSLPQSDFNAITSGTNGGYTATAGYNMVTGLGTPVANLVVAGLIGYQSVSPANLTTADQPAINATTASYGTSAAGTANVFNVFNVQTGEGPDMGRGLGSNGAMLGLHAAAFQRGGEVGSPGAGILNGPAAGITEPAMVLHTAAIDAVMVDLTRSTIQGEDHMAHCGDWSSGGGFVADATHDSSVTSIGGALDQLLEDAEADWLLLGKINKH
jgi:subtilase family serine protease